MRRLILLPLLALLFLALASPASARTKIVLTDQDFICNAPISNYALSGLPLRVIMNFTGPYASTEGNLGVFELGPGCVGDGLRSTVDISVRIHGDGRTYGPTDDAVRVNNALPGARDLVITGRADCGPAAPNAHQDGIQILGGTNILFRRFKIGDTDTGATCQGAGGALFYSMTSNNIDATGGEYAGCNHALLAGNDSPGARVANATFRTGHQPFCLQERTFFASNPCDIRSTWSGVVHNIRCLRG